MAAIKISLPTPLISYTSGAREVEAQGATLDALLNDLDRQYPGIRFRMFDEQGRGRPHIKVFVNSELERDTAAPIAEGDEVLIVAALSGG
jgi:molybdopterin converting factor small subunit